MPRALLGKTATGIYELPSRHQVYCPFLSSIASPVGLAYYLVAFQKDVRIFPAWNWHWKLTQGHNWYLAQVPPCYPPHHHTSNHISPAYYYRSITCQISNYPKLQLLPVQDPHDEHIYTHRPLSWAGRLRAVRVVVFCIPFSATPRPKMKWNYLGLAALLQLGFSGLSLASFDNSGIGSLEDLLAARADPAGVGLSAPVERRQAGGRCGADGGGAICSGNLCCSAFGYCGDGDTYCPQIVGCQPAFGWCEGEPLPSPTSSATPTSTPTPTSTSTSTSISTTPPPVSTTSSTSVSSTPSATSTSPPYTGPLQISQNGMCGNGTTCAGSRFGRCCSQFYYCGNEDSFCGGGCQSQFGSCGVAGGVSTVTITSYVTTSVTVSVGAGTPITATMTITQTVTSFATATSVITTTVGAPTSSTPVITPTPTTTTTTSRTTTSSVSTPSVVIPPGLRSSTDGTCGNGVTCLGSSGGQCCSQWGFCGNDRQYCVPLLGCQAQFGRCDSG